MAVAQLAEVSRLSGRLQMTAPFRFTFVQGPASTFPVGVTTGEPAVSIGTVQSAPGTGAAMSAETVTGSTKDKRLATKTTKAKQRSREGVSGSRMDVTYSPRLLVVLESVRVWARLLAAADLRFGTAGFPASKRASSNRAITVTRVATRMTAPMTVETVPASAKVLSRLQCCWALGSRASPRAPIPESQTRLIGS